MFIFPNMKLTKLNGDLHSTTESYFYRQCLKKKKKKKLLF